MMHQPPVTRWVTLLSATLAPWNAPAPSWRRYARASGPFLSIVLLAGLSLCLALTLPTSLAPSNPPLAKPPSTVDHVLAYALGWRGPRLDPLLTIKPGLTIKTSNYDGIKIDGTRYYYDVAPQPSFDPLSRGILSEHQIRIIAIVGNYPDRVLIYTRKLSLRSSLSTR